MVLHGQIGLHLFSTHDVKHKNFSSIESVKDAAGRFYDLAVSRVWQLTHLGATFWVFLKLLDTREHTLDKGLCRLGFIERNEVGDRV